MAKFVMRDATRHEQLVSAYEGLVASLDDGYDMSVYEYTNDLSCRDFLEEAREEPGVRELWSRVVAADERLRALLLPTLKCIHGRCPKEWFWYWGYPPNSPELENDLRSQGAI